MTRIFQTSVVLLAIFLPVFILSSCSRNNQPPPYKTSTENNRTNPDQSVDPSVSKNSDLKRIIYHVGPYDLPTGTGIDAMKEKPLSMRFQADKDIWVVGFSSKMIGANGEDIPPELLHQAIVSNAHEDNPLCSGSPNPFFIATSEMTTIALPEGTGYPILSTDPIDAKVVLFNPTDKNYLGVSFEFTLVTKQMNDYVNFSDVKPMLLIPDPCGNETINVPPHEFADETYTFKMPHKSNLVVAYGALQDFGATVQLTAGKETSPFWKALGVQDKDHHVKNLTSNPFEDAHGIPFKSGESIALRVAYDNTSDAWLTGATAAAMVYMVIKE